MALITRVPEVLEQTVTPQQAFELDDDLDIRPTRASALTVGQGFNHDQQNNLIPTEALTLTNDSFWELDGNGDLQPQL